MVMPESYYLGEEFPMIGQTNRGINVNDKSEWPF